MAEGPSVVRDALAAGAPVTDLFVLSGDRGVEDLGRVASERGARVYEVEDRVLRAVADTSTPQGVVAVIRAPEVDLADVLTDATLVLVLDRVRDPGNAGTLIRTAAAAGADGVVFTAGSVDPYAPKAVRAAAGALFRVAIVRGTTMPGLTTELRGHGITVIACAPRSPVSCYELDMSGPIAFVIGNEARGLGEEVPELVDGSVSIPMSDLVESLNAAVAGAILLFEARRQRAGDAGAANLSRLS